MLLAIDLYAGLGGWAEGFLGEGYSVIGFDIERRSYPSQLVLQDVRTLHGSQFKDATVIVGSSPCQEFSYRAMPFKRGKALGPPLLGIELFQTQFRIQKEACEAAGRYIPMVVENVRGAQPWVGRAAWHYGSYYLWGDVPALMPWTRHGAKLPSNGNSPRWDERKLVRLNQVTTHEDGYSVAVGDGTKQHGSGAEWFGKGIAKHGSHSSARKAATAQISKIPFELARHIATTFKP